MFTVNSYKLIKNNKTSAIALRVMFGRNVITHYSKSKLLK